MTASLADSSAIIDSPSLNSTPFSRIYPNVRSFIFSATIAIAPLFCPVILSPIINAAVVPDVFFIAVIAACGHEGALVSADSYIPQILTISG